MKNRLKLVGVVAIDGSVQPTLEVTITETVVHLRRKKRPGLCIALINV
jgi:predicted DNA-binding protein with PD1-like motif